MRIRESELRQSRHRLLPRLRRELLGGGGAGRSMPLLLDEADSMAREQRPEPLSLLPTIREKGLIDNMRILVIS
jgi:hypothetical protein